MSISAVPRAVRGIALLRWTLVFCVVLTTLLVVVPRDAGAQGTGFTGEVYYGNDVYPPRSPVLWTIEQHSYGFNSATNTSQTARGQVLTVIDDLAASGWQAWASCNDLCRVCLHGTYPNCTDTDGWSGLAGIANDSFTTNLRIQGHGVY